MRRIFLMIVSLILWYFSFSQTGSYPQGYFRWPLDLKPEIVANLGELRPNHWHMGLDIRSAQKVNQRVYAAAEGYIAYIGIRPLSFGRFIIINHPNGFSTLYGHLNDFFPALEKYVTDEQYRQGTWAVELVIPQDKFPVSKGSFIAFSGTTGGSQGPHVHFEIRDTKTGQCLNPLLFGMPLQDNVKPSILRLAMYDRTISTYNQSPKLIGLKNVAGAYVPAGSSLIKTANSKISFALQAIDRISGSSNQDGIYSASLFVDDQSLVNFELDKIGYEETAYLNAQIDYPYHYRGGSFLQHLSRLPGNRSDVYHPDKADGIVFLNDQLPHTIKIEVRDAYQNLSVLNFQVQYDPALAHATSTSPIQVFIPGYVNTLEKPDFEMYLPEVCLYDTVNVTYYKKEFSPQDPFSVSAAHTVNNESIPVHDNLRVKILPNKPIDPEWKNKLVILRTDKNANKAVKAVMEGEWIAAEFSDFGTYQAFIDKIPPSVNAPGKGDTLNLSASKRIVFTPTDNFGIKSFRAELDGKWLRFTNDKGRTWIYLFDEHCPYGVHQLKVTVEDLVGNTTTKTWWFKKYAYSPPKKKTTAKKTVKKKTTTKKKK